MTVISGIDMAVSGASTARTFQIREFGQPRRGYSASGFAKGTGRSKAPVGFSGWYLGYGHTPAVFPGAAFTFTGSVDGALGVTGAAICTANIIRASIEQGGPIEYMVRFFGDGALTKGAAVGTDATVPAPGDGTDTSIEFSGSTVGCVRDWVLEMSCKPRPYSGSCTPAIIKATAGPIDARLFCRMYEGAPASLPDINDLDILEVFVDAEVVPKCWELTTMRLGEIPDFTADHEGDENVNNGLLFEWNAFDAAPPTVLGTIKNPAGATVWPAA